ncbi:MAG: hypothetical protein ACRET4_09245, partial [Steroidobacteraceae bacterium]
LEEDLNLYAYVYNDPMDRVDPRGEDSYVVARPLDVPVLDHYVAHAYVVTNAQYIGDPRATVTSFGELKNGNMGNVSNTQRASDFSKTTAATDLKSWLGRTPESTRNLSKINAPDALVSSVAAAVKEDKPYAMIPNGDGSKAADAGLRQVNSNAAAFAVADRAQAIATGNADSQVPRNSSRALPGQAESGRVEFKCTTSPGAKPGC